MRRLTYLSSALSIFLLVTVCPLLAADKEDPHADDKKAIEKAGQSYVKAFAEGNAKEVAKHFTENGEFFNANGQHVKGRAAIEKEFARHFTMNPGQKLKPTRESIRFIRPDVAIVRGVSEVEPAPAGPAPKCTYSALLVKEGNRWLMDSVYENIKFVDSHHDKLADLGWLVGHWSYGGISPQIESADVTFSWSVNKNYLVRRHVIKMTHDETRSGTQRIGWDPIAEAICSWLFNSDGSFAKAIWVKDGDSWVIQSRGFVHNGRQTSSTDIITPIDDNTFTFESINRTLGGQPEPNLGPIEIKRQKPK